MTNSSAAVEVDPVKHVQTELVDRLAKGEFKLPLLPLVATEVLKLTSDPDADMAKLAAIIQQDQAVASQVLRIANSAAYAPRSPIVSLQQAVSWLGMKMLGELALAVSIENGIFRVKGYEKEISLLWRHALASGLWAKEVARVDRRNVEDAFLCGLLHTIGKPIVLQAVVDIQHASQYSLEWADCSLLIDRHHVEVGALATEKWNLPHQVQEAVLYYQDYSQFSVPSPGIMITCLADRLASFLLGIGELDAQGLSSLPVVEDLNLYPEDMEALFEKSETIRHTVDSMVI